MSCQKSEKRNLFCLFKTYTCKGCNKFKVDEEILIGNNKIYIYPLTNCSNIEQDDDYFLFNKKLKKLLLSFILYQHNTILLWIDELDRLENYELIFDIFSNMSLNIFIIRY